MLVRELIEQLEKMDQDAVVIIWEDTDSSGGWKKVTSVEFDAEVPGRLTYACIE